MATAYFRLSGWWGEVEAYKTDEQIYTSTQRHPMGENAEPPGIGVRRAMLVFSRDPTVFGDEDVAVTHFDFLNLTNGQPDDTWTDADFVNLETDLGNWFNLIHGGMHPFITWREIRWYRIGPGVEKPNPPVRVTPQNIPGSATLGVNAPQIAMTITDRTGVRLEWGRKYIPISANGWLTTTAGRFTSSAVDTMVTATDALYTAAAGQDFLPVVYGPTRQKAYSIESVQVDDVVDVVRRRRWESPGYKRRLPAGG